MLCAYIGINYYAIHLQVTLLIIYKNMLTVNFSFQLFKAE